MIEIQKVSKWYGEVSALNDIQLTINSGILGLLGPNGAGKSTLLKIMAGQLEPSLGKAIILGEEYTNNPALFARIGLCPEQDSLWEEFNGHQFLTAMLKLHGWTKHDADKRSKELLGLFQLEDAAKKRVGGYSKGMRQKLRIAQSFAHNPEVLFLDEPMTGLDATSRALVADLIRAMADKGVTIIVSSHILHEVENLTKEMVLILQGKLRARGNVYEIREMLTDHPLQLEVEVDNPRKLCRAFLDYPHIVKFELSQENPNKVTFFTIHQNQFFQDLPQVLNKEDLHIHGIHAEDEDMESVFNYLVH